MQICPSLAPQKCSNHASFISLTNQNGSFLKTHRPLTNERVGFASFTYYANQLQTAQHKYHRKPSSYTTVGHMKPGGRERTGNMNALWDRMAKNDALLEDVLLKSEVKSHFFETFRDKFIYVACAHLVSRTSAFIINRTTARDTSIKQNNNNLYHFDMRMHTEIVIYNCNLVFIPIDHTESFT